MKKCFSFLVLWILLLGSACGGRVPAEVKTTKLTQSYFNRYGKKFPGTVFENNEVREVSVKRTEELQRNIARSYVMVKMNNGENVPVLMTLIRKFPLGWRITGWEWLK